MVIEVGDPSRVWDRSSKRLSIFASDFRTLDVRGKIQAHNPTTQISMLFEGSHPMRDAEGDVGSWLLRSGMGLSFIIYNDR